MRTILDTEMSLYSAWSELWASHGHELALSDWQQNLGTDDSRDPGAELEHRVGRPLDPALDEHRRRRRDEIQSEYGPRPGVRRWLSEARALALPVGIASSSPNRRAGLRNRWFRLRTQRSFRHAPGPLPDRD